MSSINELSSFAYEFCRVREDRIRMTWEDDRSQLLAEINALKASNNKITEETKVERYHREKLQKDVDELLLMVNAKKQMKLRVRSLKNSSSADMNLSAIVKFNATSNLIKNNINDGMTKYFCVNKYIKCNCCFLFLFNRQYEGEHSCQSIIRVGIC